VIDDWTRRLANILGEDCRHLDFVMIEYQSIVSDCQEKKASAAACDEQSAERLWKLSEEMTQLNETFH
jgi:hypothetical protein